MIPEIRIWAPTAGAVEVVAGERRAAMDGRGRGCDREAPSPFGVAGELLLGSARADGDNTEVPAESAAVS